MSLLSNKHETVNRYFFEASNSLHSETIRMQDFVQPMATAMWNFRQVIQAEMNSIPTPTKQYISKKYNVGPQTRGTTDLIYPFQGITWDDQKRRIAEISLINLIAIYEVWCEEICSNLSSPSMYIKLQFPTNQTRSNGVWFAIDSITVNESAPLKGSIYPSLISAKKYSGQTLDNLLKCFRYFKELRNSFMHRGRLCDGKLYGAQSEFLPVASTAGLGMDFVPKHKVYAIGDPVEVDFQASLGFTDVILRIVKTVDAELSRSVFAESELIGRISKAKITPIKDSNSLKGIFNTFGIQGVKLTSDLITMLKSNNVLA